MDVNRDICMHCGACVGSCPENAIFLRETVIEIDDDKCIKCGECYTNCKFGAIDIK